MRRMAFRLKLEKLSYPNAVMCILLGLLMAGMVASGIWLYKKADKPVMRIGNYAITREHLALYQDDLRAKVSSYFYQTYQQDPNEKGFWDSTIGGRHLPRFCGQRRSMRCLRIRWSGLRQPGMKSKWTSLWMT